MEATIFKYIEMYFSHFTKLLELRSLERSNLTGLHAVR